MIRFQRVHELAPVLAPIAAVLLLGLGSVAEAAETLCQGSERAAFSCSDARGKLLSICRRGDAVTYRFGKPGAVELEYPQGTEAAKFVLAKSPYPEGVETVLRFDRGAVRYLIDDEEDATTPDGSAAWITVTRGSKQLAKIDCVPGFEAAWDQLEGALPLTPAPGGDALGAASGEPPAQAPLPPDGGVADHPARTACAGQAALADYPKKVAALFRAYAETTDSLYAFAVKQFGAPVRCDLHSTLDPKLPGADAPDAMNFSGSLRYVFKGGAQLLFAMAGPLDVSLIAPAGFPDPAAARSALEARCGFVLAKARRADGESQKQALASWTDPEGHAPPAVLGAATPTQAFTDPSVDADEQTTYAELTLRGKALVAIRTHQ